MDRNNYYNTSGNIRDRGERYQRSDSEPRSRGPRDNGRSPSSQRHRRDDPRRNDQRRNDPRSENYRPRRNERDPYGNTSLDNSQMQQVHIRDNSFNKQYNSSSSSLNNTSSNSNLIQSPFQNPYKIDSNSNKKIINDPSKDRLETYAKLKSISPVKFYISIIIAIIITVVIFAIGIMVLKNKGLSANNISDVTVGDAQGYLFYCGFMLLAIFTGVYAFIRKWNNLLVTYCSFLFVSSLWVGYFAINLINVKSDTVSIMNTRWKDEFNESTKALIQESLECCGYYDSEDDPASSSECHQNESTRKRSLYTEDIYVGTYNTSKLHKRLEVKEGSCAEAINNIISQKLSIYIIVFSVLFVLNVAAVIVTILDIKQYAEILEELSNPFA
ncbi:hypothetical protein BCR32DRAFT_325770 [Anaeromyces robustus]|uniref:Tetraspanin Tsp2 n=1 Tax=Anaeromyces robustus TaxID=1754192 RepID=A0A1Y1XG82_9FUNG|nr:hypothetical protein BCR32DRAFT_325770 [Anaeromyces robustus]|eukprot:ORX84755.1 hypothetical protein BCR32DRAFT_325770 [Anaeromyces robustus]